MAISVVAETAPGENRDWQHELRDWLSSWEAQFFKRFEENHAFQMQLLERFLQEQPMLVQRPYRVERADNGIPESIPKGAKSAMQHQACGTDKDNDMDFAAKLKYDLPDAYDIALDWEVADQEAANVRPVASCASSVVTENRIVLRPASTWIKFAKKSHKFASMSFKTMSSLRPADNSLQPFASVLLNRNKNFGRRPNVEDVTARYVWQRHLCTVVHSSIFQFFSLLLIIGNGIMMAMNVDAHMKAALDGDPAPLGDDERSESIVTILFVAELVLRVLAEQEYFVLGTGKLWNLFDVAVVTLCVLEMTINIGVSLAHLRFVRSARVVRVLRVIRIFRFFRNLRLMFLAVVSSLITVIWAVILIFLLMFMFSMVLLEGAQEYLLRTPREDIPPDWYELMTLRLNSVTKAIFTLMQVISGGDDWGNIAVPFTSIHWAYSWLFTFFIFLVVFGVLNVLLGCIVQSIADVASLDRDLRIQNKMFESSLTQYELRRLFHELDTEHRGVISSAELEAGLHNERIRGFFLSVGIEETHGAIMFKFLDEDRDGLISEEEFVQGCYRFKIDAKRLDMEEILYVFRKTMPQFMKQVTGALSTLKEEVSAMLEDHRLTTGLHQSTSQVQELKNQCHARCVAEKILPSRFQEL